MFLLLMEYALDVPARAVPFVQHRVDVPDREAYLSLVVAEGAYRDAEALAIVSIERRVEHHKNAEPPPAYDPMRDGFRPRCEIGRSSCRSARTHWNRGRRCTLRPIVVACEADHTVISRGCRLEVEAGLPNQREVAMERA
jgi:hypothetical protein